MVSQANVLAVLRTVLALSTLLGKPVSLHGIRRGRPRAGLQAQHLASVHLAVDLSGGSATGAALLSTDVTFRPGRLRGGAATADPGTAGSVALLIQVHSAATRINMADE